MLWVKMKTSFLVQLSAVENRGVENQLTALGMLGGWILIIHTSSCCIPHSRVQISRMGILEITFAICIARTWLYSCSTSILTQNWPVIDLPSHKPWYLSTHLSIICWHESAFLSRLLPIHILPGTQHCISVPIFRDVRDHFLPRSQLGVQRKHWEAPLRSFAPDMDQLHQHNSIKIMPTQGCRQWRTAHTSHIPAEP